MLWPGPDYFDLMERAVSEGRISLARLDESVSRVLTMKNRRGLLDAPTADDAADSVPGLASIQPLPEARQFAETLAERSLTLVENRRKLLPLNPARLRKVQILLATPRELGAEKAHGPRCSTG